jgi:hypothetical protein
MLLSTTTLCRPTLLAAAGARLLATGGLRADTTATTRRPSAISPYQSSQRAANAGSMSTGATVVPFKRPYTMKSPPSSPRRALDPSNCAPDPDPAKYARDEGRLPSTIASEQLQKDGKGVEGRHFADEPTAAASPAGLAESFTGDWTLTHPTYTDAALDAVRVVHRPARTVSDKIALTLVKGLRWVLSLDAHTAEPHTDPLNLLRSRSFGYDLLSGYRHRPLPAHPETFSLEELRLMGCVMSPDQWLKRIILLEVIAGVPVRPFLLL